MMKIIKYYIHHIYWELQYRFNPKHRYHVIHTKLPPGFYDKDILMIFSVMTLIEEYVEKERFGREEFKKDINALKYNKENNQYVYEKEILNIYDWWKDYKEEFFNTMSTNAEIEEKRMKEEDEMMQRAINVYRFLWT